MFRNFEISWPNYCPTLCSSSSSSSINQSINHHHYQPKLNRSFAKYVREIVKAFLEINLKIMFYMWLLIYIKFSCCYSEPPCRGNFACLYLDGGPCMYSSVVGAHCFPTGSTTSSSRNEYYLGGNLALSHCCCRTTVQWQWNQFVAASTWWQISTERRTRR